MGRQTREVEEGQRKKIESIQFLTAEEVGRILRISTSTVYKLTLEGKIPGFKIGDSWRFGLEEFMKFVKKKFGDKS